MQESRWTIRVAGLVAIGLILFGGAVCADQPAGPPRVGDYWIGISVQPVPDEVRAQVPAARDAGVMITAVVPDTPAAKANLQQYDILVEAAGKTIKSGQELVDVVDAAKHTKLTLKILREGKPVQVELTPAKRPAGAKAAEPFVWPGRAEEAYKKALEQLKQFGGPEGAGFWFMRPPYLLRPGALFHAPLPGNLSISITKRGDQPAEIVVKQDDKKWEITEKELDKLPKDIRPHVERMLGHPLRWPGMTLDKLIPEPPRVVRLERRAEPALEARLEKRLEEINRQLEQLRKAVDELRSKQAPPGAEGPKGPAGDTPGKGAGKA